mmetsp:Transcript_7643/g.13855  ORF Transcript_7643/g.13855 Transcript_7643/m.13855 type:complete len:135 (+) Transcript_7643:45-449(+)
MEELGRRMEGLVDGLERTELRPRQKAAYQCSARCCDIAKTSNELQQCTDRCSGSMSQAHNILVAHVEQFQRRMERCSARCQDSATKDLPQSPNQTETAAAQKKYEGCVNSCANEMIQLIPRLQADITSDLSSLQ